MGKDDASSKDFTSKSKGKKSLSGVLNYFSLPRRKKKAEPSLEISSPVLITGLVKNPSGTQLPRSNSNLDLFTSKKFSELQANDESLNEISKDSGVGSVSYDSFSFEDSESSCRNSGSKIEIDPSTQREFQRQAKTRQTFSTISEHKIKEVSDSVDGKQKFSPLLNDCVDNEFASAPSKHDIKSFQMQKGRTAINSRDDSPADQMKRKKLSSPTFASTQSSNPTNATVSKFHPRRSFHSGLEYSSGNLIQKRWVLVGNDDIHKLAEENDQRNAEGLEPTNIIADFTRMHTDLQNLTKSISVFSDKPFPESDYDFPKPVGTKSDYDFPKPVGTESDYDFPKPVATESDYDFPKPIPSESDYDFPKPVPQSGHNSKKPTLAESDYNFLKSVPRSHHDFSKPISAESDYDFPKSIPQSDNNSMKPIPAASDYDFPKPIPQFDHDSTKPIPAELDYDFPQPISQSDYDSMKPIHAESDYDFPKPIPQSDYDSSKPISSEADYDFPKPALQSDHDRSKPILAELGYDLPKICFESDYDFPKPVRPMLNDNGAELACESDYDFPKAIPVSICNTLEGTQGTGFKLSASEEIPNSDPMFHEFNRTSSNPNAGSDHDTLKPLHETDVRQLDLPTSVRVVNSESSILEEEIWNTLRDSGSNNMGSRIYWQNNAHSSDEFDGNNTALKSSIEYDLNASKPKSESGAQIQSIAKRQNRDSVELPASLSVGKSSQREIGVIPVSNRKPSSCTPANALLKSDQEKELDTVDGNCKTFEETVFIKSPTIEISAPCSDDSLCEVQRNSEPTNFMDQNVDDEENCMARALYSNTAESPDELEFRKDDLLTVLEQNTAGLEGWWLCSLRGRQGICPGNRLRIIPGCYDTGSGVPTTLARPHTSPALHGAPASSTTMPRSTGNKVVTPKRVGDTYTYDTPRRHVGSSPAPPLAHYPTLDYDVPRGPPVMNNDGPRLSRSSSLRYEAPRHIPRGSYELHDIPTSPYDQQTSMHYDIPRPQTSTAQSALYDSPRPQVATGAVDQRTGVATRSLIKGVRGPAPAMSSATPVKLPESDSGQYDVPKPLHEAVQLEVPNASDRSSGVSIMSCDSTSSSASSVPASESPYLSSIGGSSNRSSLEVQDVYDVPPEPRKVGTVQKPRLPPRECATRPQNEALADKNSVKSEGVYDVPPQVSRDARSSDAVDAKQSRVAADLESVCDNVLTGAGLPLEYDSAIDMLSKLQQDVHVSLEKLANFNVVVSPIKKPVSIERFNESKIIIDRLKDTLQEFIRFTKGAAVNSYKAGFERLASTLQQQAERLVSTYDIIKNTWNCAQHNREEALDVVLQLTSITKPLAEDVRHLANIIQINAPQIFKKTPSGEQVKQKFDTKPSMHETPTRDGPAENMYANESAILEDYDYVKLESRETADREHQQIKESLPANLRKSYDNLVKQSHSVVDNDHQKALPTSSSTVTSKNLNSGTAATKTCRLDANDRQVLAFYSNQAEQHIQHLNTAIDAFFLTIEENQPPKVFIAHSKFVILSAHKLVFIGDTVHRNVVNSEVRSCVLNCSNALCDAMKNTVAAAKNAAIKFPSVAAVQAMVDSFTTISNLACNLRNAICRN